MSIFAKNVSRLKRTGQYTNTELEQLTGVSRRTLGRILESAKQRTAYTPTQETVAAIARTVGATVSEIKSTHLTFTTQ